MTEPLRLINQTDDPSPYSLAMTQTSEDILRSIELARWNAPMLTMVAGVPGCGKSETILRYTQAHPGTVLHSVVASECTIWDLAKHLMEFLEIGEPNSRRMIEARQRIEEEIGLDRVVIFDEAQYLTRRNPRGPDDHQAFEWLRQMAENGLLSSAKSRTRMLRLSQRDTASQTRLCWTPLWRWPGNMVGRPMW